ncbi:GntR family transcriptional regulator [Herbaspirillum sp. YR522]|uniref:GntR family transcriptional regulator n=1 Tax=Herbaspirillum sp. YR522 TaxID=1144342 RepID=UPI00026FCCE2|nr:GntR family transcriptional regulator [Herbaspirillum sp. YR522]EJN09611.1 transcriptional regulator [Herbaspirillum sp. YR522]
MKPSSLPAELDTRPTGKLTDTVYDSLRDDIYAFRMLPGDRFAENDIAERLQVSRTPVREALMRLQSEGLVRGYFRNGWEVVPIDLARFAWLYELRAMIELHAIGKLCSSRVPDASRLSLVRELGRFWRVGPSRRLRDGLRVAARDEQFHWALVHAAGNPETDAVYGQVTQQLRIMRRLDFAYGDCIGDTYDEHVAILDAVRQSDAALAARLVARHIEDSHAAVERITIERLEQVRAATSVVQAGASAQSRRKRFG